MDCEYYVDANKLSAHVDDILSEKRCAQLLKKNLLNIKDLLSKSMVIDKNLMRKFQLLDDNINDLIKYYSELAVVMDDMSVDSYVTAKKIEQLIFENRFDLDSVIRIDNDSI